MAAEATNNGAPPASTSAFLFAQVRCRTKAVLDITLSGSLTAEDADIGVRSVSEIRLEHPEDAERFSPRWSATSMIAAVARGGFTQQGKYADARGVSGPPAAIGALPINCNGWRCKRRYRLYRGARFCRASALLNEFEIIGVPRELEPRIMLVDG